MTDEMQSEDVMVVTRRGKVTGAATPRLTKSESSHSENDTIAVRIPDRYRNGSGLSEAKPSKSGVDIAQCTSVPKQDPTLTAAPPTTERSQDNNSGAAKKIKSSNPYTEPDLSKVEPNQRLIGDIKGGMGNPIVLTDSPPRLQPNNPSMHAQQMIPRAHGQLSRPYKRPFGANTSSGPALTPKPTNTSVVNGHQSHDIYQMMRAQNIAAYQNQRNSAPVPLPSMQPVPYQVQYPMSANFIAQPRTIANDPSILYNSIFGLSVSKNSPFTIAPPDEEVLRRKAMQHVREHQRPIQRKRRLFEVDPDETSVSSLEEDASVVAKTSAAKSSKPLLNTIASPPYSHSVRPLQRQGTKPPPVHHQQRRQEEVDDPNYRVSHLFDQTIILASMLQMYPFSKDKSDFREEIAMLTSVHHEQLIAWKNDGKNAEKAANEARKRRKTNAGTDTAATRPTGAGKGNEKTKNQDNEMREVLSAKSGMWQDGEQQNLADVFAVGPSSSPRTGDYVQLGGPVGAESGIWRKNGMRWVGTWERENTDEKTFVPGAGRRGPDDDDVNMSG